MTNPIDPNILTSTANELAKKDKYKPSNGTTKCNIFASDFAETVFNYQGIKGILANDIVVHLRNTTLWLPLLDPLKALPDLDIGLLDAQGYANKGSLVIFGWSNPNGAGHVAVCVPGELEVSGNWNRQVPQVAQAGEIVFAKGKLSNGFGPDKAASIVAYLLQ